MSQVTDVDLANQGFASFRTELNNILGAINSSHIGASAPTSAVAGTLWIDNSVTNTLKLMINDGADNMQLFSINTSTNVVTVPSGISVEGTITETDPNAVSLAIALG